MVIEGVVCCKWGRKESPPGGRRSASMDISEPVTAMNGTHLELRVIDLEAKTMPSKRGARVLRRSPQVELWSGA